MSTRFTPAGLVHEHSDNCSHSITSVIVDGVVQCSCEEDLSYVYGSWVHDPRFCPCTHHRTAIQHTITRAPDRAG